MKIFLEFVKKRMKYLKFIFIVTVLFVLVLELIRVTKQLNGEQFKEILTAMPIIHLIIILIVGAISILPMIGYDFILKNLLNNKYERYYIFETSWLINTMNNMIGFGGIFSLGLRSQFYGRNKDPKEILNGSSKIFLFTMSGLSIYSLLTLIIVALGAVNSFLQEYWIWLLGGALYFPIVFIATTVKKKGVLGGLSIKMKAALLIVSFLEWSGVAMTFIAVGKIMGIHLPILEVVTLFMAAMVIGIVSMVPGGLGSFDVMMLLGLQHLGISQELSLAWILLYRLAYYFVPFLIGVVFFVRHLGSRFNKRFNNIPKELLIEIAHKILKFMFYFSGFRIILLESKPYDSFIFPWLTKINPWLERFIVQSPKIILGFLLIIMGRAVAQRVKRSYLLSLFLLPITLTYILFQEQDQISAIFMASMLFLVIFAKSELYREQLVLGFESMLKDGLLISGSIFFYLLFSVYAKTLKIHKLKHMAAFLLFPHENLWIAGLLAVSFVSIAMFLFTSYLEGNKRKIGLILTPKVEKRISYVLTHYGGNTESQLVYLGDKDIFFYTNNDGEDTAFLQFNYFRDKAIVMGPPSGKFQDYPKLLARFINQCDILGYSPIFYEVTEDITLILHEFGYNMIKMGEEGHVDLPNFTISGKKQRGNRATMNRMKKEGVHLKILEPPFTKEDMKQMRKISDEWLGSRKERGFSMGFFASDYITRAPVGVVKNAEDDIIAFANIMPTYTEQMVSVDLMRYSSLAPQSIMDFLFISLFNYYKDKGIKTFNLGMAPLSNVGTSRKSFVQERIANLIYQFGSHFYSFQGLREYKNKYATSWRSRYMMYSRDDMILFVIWALIRVDNKEVKMRNRHLYRSKL
ncbi:MAG: bifunctional lysylphosphatidylglycerol flippase/synthetase MprF [Lactobacillales bacterium]|jgi:phosphatidylglycerol lysyltransferase|nr:bifunctional lysylphosphatidylglycerol flippase/synthetase MprF [Lactobacillales bacterium]